MSSESDTPENNEDNETDANAMEVSQNSLGDGQEQILPDPTELNILSGRISTTESSSEDSASTVEATVMLNEISNNPRQIVTEDPESVDSDVEIVEPSSDVVNLRSPSSTTQVDNAAYDNQHDEQTQDQDSECNEPPLKKRAIMEDDNEDGKICPICLDEWTNLGDHRLCSLKCGHLFGLNCITRWLSSQTQVRKSCPTCKKKAAKSDIRYIYARKLVCVDVTELEELKTRLEIMKQELDNSQLELSKALVRHQCTLRVVADLQNQVKQLNNSLDTQVRFSESQTNNSDGAIKEKVHLYMDKSIEICKNGGCRVLDCNNELDLIAVSMKSPNGLFSGFGVRKISVSNYKPTAFIPLHSKEIRDVRFHHQNQWLVSVALDQWLKVVDSVSHATVATYKGDVPLWSCCWDVDNSNILYAGEQLGSVVKFDIRQMARPVCKLTVPGDTSPVVSVASMAASPGNAVAHGGVIACKLNSLWVFENTPDEYTRRLLPIEAPFISMTFDNKTRQLYVSARPNARYQYIRHFLCNIENGCDNNLLCNTIHTFHGGFTQKQLSRPCLVTNGEIYATAYVESCKSVSLWSVSSGRKVCAVPAREPVLNLRGVESINANYLVSLSEKKLEFFRFTS